VQLPFVVQNIAMPIARRMIMRIPCWRYIHKLILQEPGRSDNSEWSDFVGQVSIGKLDEITPWSQVRDQFHVMLT
jgi:hypothetical protein